MKITFTVSVPNRTSSAMADHIIRVLPTCTKIEELIDQVHQAMLPVVFRTVNSQDVQVRVEIAEA